MKLFTAFSLLFFLSVATSEAQWLQTNGPFGGGSVTGLVSDSTGTIYASTGWAGYFKSDDAGAHWTSINNGLTWPAGDIVVTPQGVLFAVDQEIIRSFDQGETWEPCDNGLGRIPGAMAVNSEGHIYVADEEGTNGPAALFVSEDNGDSWTEITVPFTTYMETIILGINLMDHIFIGGPGILLRSTDNGETWVDISPQEGYAYIMALSFDTAGIVYAGSRSDGGLFKSYDNGDLWTHLLTEEVWCVDAQGNLVFVGTSQGMLRSVDGGLTWDTVNNGLPNATVFSNMILNNEVLAGTRGVYRSSDNGDYWSFSSEGLIASDVHQVIINNEGVVFAASDKLWRSDDDGQSWVNIGDSLNIAEVVMLATDQSDDLYLLAGLYNSSLYSSDDNGDNWTQLPLPDEGFNDLDLHPSGDIYLSSNYNGGLYKSTDGGTTWSLTGFANTQLQSVYIDPQGIILACEQNEPATVYRSTDNGSTWEPVHNIQMYGSAGVIDYAHDGMGYLYMATYYDLLRSDDEGLTWDVVNSGMQFTSITANQFDTLYATTSWSGIWQSPDQGITWTAFNDGLPTWGMPETISFSPSDGILYTGWHSQGVWNYGSHSIDVKEPEFAASGKNNLLLYPNPAEDYLYVKLNGSFPDTPVKIFTPDGRLISTNPSTPDGRINISGIKNGIYIIQAGDYSSKLLVTGR